MCGHELLRDTLNFSGQAYSDISRSSFYTKKSSKSQTFLGFTSMHAANAKILPLNNHITDKLFCRNVGVSSSWSSGYQMTMKLQLPLLDSTAVRNLSNRDIKAFDSVWPADKFGFHCFLARQNAVVTHF